MNQMRDTRMSPQWVMEAVQRNPIQKIMGNDGQWTGAFRTCPVRLAFPNVLQPGSGGDDDSRETFNALMLFPWCAQLQPLVDEWYRVARAKFSNFFDANGVPSGLHSPFKDQQDKAAKYSGFTPGSWYMSASSQYKPSIVDAGQNPIVDESRIYAGVWGILAVNMYSFEYRNPKTKQVMKRGVSCGLQSIMIIADDERFGGGPMDTNVAFAGVNISADANIGAQFGTQPVPGAAPLPAQQMLVPQQPIAAPQQQPVAPPAAFDLSDMM